jgi:transcriptional regulator with XRE-family HTH domain
MSTEWNPRIARQVRRGLEDFYDKTVSQISLAAWLGYSRSAIQNWESGRAVPEPAMRYLYYQLTIDPGLIGEVRQWSGTNANSQHKAGEAATR